MKLRTDASTQAPTRHRVQRISTPAGREKPRAWALQFDGAEARLVLYHRGCHEYVEEAHEIES
jgi:hypothetical protein